jgi:hypothetical protein
MAHSVASKALSVASSPFKVTPATPPSIPLPSPSGSSSKPLNQPPLIINRFMQVTNFKDLQLQEVEILLEEYRKLALYVQNVTRKP